MISKTKVSLPAGQTVWRMKCHLEAHNSIEPLPKSGRPTKLTGRVLQSIENSMRRDDETTGKELVSILNQSGVNVGLDKTWYGVLSADSWTQS